MLIPEWFWNETRDRFDVFFCSMAHDMRSMIPALKVSTFYNSNESFAFRGVARFMNGADERTVVDISVDFKRCIGCLLVSTDIAKENGIILSELATTTVYFHEDIVQTLSRIKDEIGRIEDFLSEQRQLTLQFLHNSGDI